MSLTSRLIEFIHGTTFEGLPPEVVSRSKEMMLNAAGVGLAGAAQPEAQALASFAREMGGNGRCTVMGMGLRTSPVYSTLANGALVRLLDFDDEIIPCGLHPSAVIFPVITALGEMNGYPGKESIAAFATGCEVAAALASWSVGDGELSFHRRWQRDSTAGTVGAAAAAARLLGLDAAQTEHALGLACGGAAGTTINVASPGSALQCGQAAMNGLMSALLARKGIASSRQPVEAPGGLLDSYGESGASPQAESLRLGSPFRIMQPGITLKVYPCHPASHTAIDAVLQLHQQFSIDAGQVEAVRVGVTPAAQEALPFSSPSDPWEARFSLEYLVAASLAYGQPLLDQFTDAAIRDESVRRIMGRTTVEACETSTPLIPNPSSITLLLSGGQELRHRAEFGRGQPEFPLDPEEVDAKFLYCCRYILPPDHIQEAIDQFRDLENIDNVTGLASVLGA